MDVDSNGFLSLIEYLTWRYKKEIRHVAEAPQGDNEEAMRKAQVSLSFCFN